MYNIEEKQETLNQDDQAQELIVELYGCGACALTFSNLDEC